MANEVNIANLYGYPPGEPMEATVANGTALSKGTWMVWSDPDKVIASSGINQSPAGVLAMDKEASDGSTKVSFYTNFDGDMVSVAGTVNLPIAGYPVELSGANLIRLSTQGSQVSGATFISGAAFMAGKAKETASASERIMVRVRL